MLYARVTTVQPDEVAAAVGTADAVVVNWGLHYQVSVLDVTAQHSSTAQHRNTQHRTAQHITAHLPVRTGRGELAACTTMRAVRQWAVSGRHCREQS